MYATFWLGIEQCFNRRWNLVPDQTNPAPDLNDTRIRETGARKIESVYGAARFWSVCSWVLGTLLELCLLSTFWAAPAVDDDWRCCGRWWPLSNDRFTRVRSTSVLRWRRRSIDAFTLFHGSYTMGACVHAFHYLSTCPANNSRIVSSSRMLTKSRHPQIPLPSKNVTGSGYMCLSKKVPVWGCNWRSSC